MWTIKLAGNRSGLVMSAKGSPFENVESFLFTIISPFRTQRPFSKDNDFSFWFDLQGTEGTFKRNGAYLRVSLIKHGFSLVIVQRGPELHIGFSETASASPEQLKGRPLA
ncbi:MAG: hypothetical protein C5B50_15735 [Verrucomicrobia bacterium]|nr:MAG: hypothetical protein C5B50_15735 [Verrucomicrobiota bacterium]